jgi:hypothetical protein
MTVAASKEQFEKLKEELIQASELLLQNLSDINSICTKLYSIALRPNALNGTEYIDDAIEFE